MGLLAEALSAHGASAATLGSPSDCEASVTEALKVIFGMGFSGSGRHYMAKLQLVSQFRDFRVEEAECSDDWDRNFIHDSIVLLYGSCLSSNCLGT